MEVSHPNPTSGGTMTTIKQLLRRLDAFTLETFNPPHTRRTR